MEDSADKLLKISTFKMPETKIVKQINEHQLASCFSKATEKDKLNVKNIFTSDQPKTMMENEKYNLIKETEINSDKSKDENILANDRIIESQSQSTDTFLKHKHNFSPAERLKTLEAILPYRDPQWAGVCQLCYNIEEVKNGIIVDKIDLTNKQRIVIGRLPSSDHVMEHPSISRHHAIFQYRKEADENNGIGWYLYDLDSVHGTWLNKKRIEPNIYIRLKVGHILKFGGSTRIYILQGPDEDKEAESDLSLTELKALRKQQLRELELRQMLEDADAFQKQAEAEAKASQDSDFCSWGMMDDAIDQSEDINPFSTYEISPLELDDPKKTLRGYFDREGLEMPEYIFEELGFGKRVCRIELPIDNEMGEPVSAEITSTGKKKDLVIQTALEACRMLDKHGLLRVVAQESRAEKRKRNWKDEDFYDSDEDVYLDRTGTIESKRRMRMSKVDPKLSTHTFKSLTTDIHDLDLEISTIEDKLQSDRLTESKLTEDQGLDSLDAFMVKIKSGGMDSRTKLALKKKLVELKAKRVQLDRLLKAVTPTVMPYKNTNIEINLQINKDASEKIDVSTSEKYLKSGINAIKYDTHALPSIGKIKRLVNAATAKGPKFDVNTENVDDDEDDENDEINDQKTNDTKDNIDDLKFKETNLCLNSSSKINNESNLDYQSVLKTSIIPDEALDKNSDNNSISSVSLIKSINIPNIQSDDNKQNICTLNKLTANIISDKYEHNKNNKLKKKEYSMKSMASSNTYSDEIDWLPPIGQSGDGKTKLNEKFGY